MQFCLPGNGDVEVTGFVGVNLQVVLAVNLHCALVQLQGQHGAGSAVSGLETLTHDGQALTLNPGVGGDEACGICVSKGNLLCSFVSEGSGDGSSNQATANQGSGTDACDVVSNAHAPHSNDRT